MALKEKGKIPFLGGSGWPGHQVASGDGADVHTSLIKGKFSITTKSSNWGYKNGQEANVNGNYKGQVTILTYPLLVPGAHHYEPDQAGQHIQEPVQYP
jgi:hypothetical protein